MDKRHTVHIQQFIRVDEQFYHVYYDMQKDFRVEKDLPREILKNVIT